MYFFKFNLLFEFVLLIGVTVSFNSKDSNIKKITFSNDIQEHDLSTNLKKQNFKLTYDLSSESLESFSRHKRQLRSSKKKQQARNRQKQRRRAQRSRQSFRKRQQNNPYRRQQRQQRPSPTAIRRARERENERRRKIMIAQADAARRSQEAAAIAKSNTIKEATKQEVTTVKTLTEEEAYKAKLEKEKKKNEEEVPKDPPGSEEDKNPKFNLLFVFVLLIGVTVSLYLKDSYSKKITFSSNIQEHDLPTNLKSQDSDNTYDLSDESLEPLTRFKRQLRNSKRRQQARNRQKQRRQAQKSRQRQRNSLHHRQQRQPRISPAAMRRTRERENQYRRRMMAAHADAARRSHEAAEIAKSNAMKESPKQEVATSKTLTKKEEYEANLKKAEEEKEKVTPKNPDKAEEND
uniref:BZIP domain-containing protein n=1 Tax=Strongyloides stercoralis TaxID=6248 RepID=A0A0K0E6D5_STRER